MKFVLFTDLHLGVHNNSSTWLDLSIDLAKEIIDTCHTHNITNVVFLGDFFNDRRCINVKTINYGIQFMDLFRKYNVKVHMIVGNHDCYLKNKISPNSLSIFKDYDNVNIISDLYRIDDNISLVGWNCDFSSCETPILMGHFGIKELLDTASEDVLCEYSVKAFNKFESVYSGHFHIPLKTGNISYIGSVFPFTFADINSPRGFYIYDTGKDSCDFIEYSRSPKFKITHMNDVLSKEDISGNFVKIICNHEYDKMEIDKVLSYYSSYSPLSVSIDFSKMEFTDSKRDNENFSIKNNIEIFNEYIDKIKEKRNFPKNINAESVKKIIKQLYNESKTINEEE